MVVSLAVRELSAKVLYHSCLFSSRYRNVPNAVSKHGPTRGCTEHSVTAVEVETLYVKSITVCWQPRAGTHCSLLSGSLGRPNSYNFIHLALRYRQAVFTRHTDRLLSIAQMCCFTVVLFSSSVCLCACLSVNTSTREPLETDVITKFSGHHCNPRIKRKTTFELCSDEAKTEVKKNAMSYHHTVGNRLISLF